MRLLTNAGTGTGPEYPANNLGPREATLVVWGTPTNVDLEISPDAGATWFSIQNVTAAGTYTVPVGGKQNYEIRGNVTTGSGVYMDLI